MRKEKNNVVLIVDPFTSGSVYAKRVKELYGLNSIALVATKKLPSSLIETMTENDYDKIFYLKDNIKDTINDIESYLGGKPLHILCGHEAGVLTFDLLSNHWDLLPNKPSLSFMRRDKVLMQEELKSSGLNYIPFFKSSSLDDTLEWKNNNKFTEYVIKPIMSLGTEGVSFCRTDNDIRTAFNKIHNTLDCCGNLNEEILIQKRVFGDEYVVDAISSNGKHFINNVFKYEKLNLNGSPVYHSMTTIDVRSMPDLCDYIQSVLTALGIENGPSHSEVILSDTGPVLIETGARMHGGMGPKIVESCNSHSLIDLSLMSRIAPEDFKEKTKNNAFLHEYGVEYFLKSYESGTVKEVKITSFCEALPSYWFHIVNIKESDNVCKTVDLFTSYGRILLKNSDKESLLNDILFIKNCEINKEFLKVSNT